MWREATGRSLRVPALPTFATSVWGLARSLPDQSRDDLVFPVFVWIRAIPPEASCLEAQLSETRPRPILVRSAAWRFRPKSTEGPVSHREHDRSARRLGGPVERLQAGRRPIRCHQFVELRCSWARFASRTSLGLSGVAHPGSSTKAHPARQLDRV